MGPDELYTTSSLSIEVSGGSVRLVCAEVRAKALERAALRLNCSPRRARRSSTASSCRTARRPARTTGRSRPRSISRQAVTGTAPAKPAVVLHASSASSVPRIDLPAKVSGAAFVHDVAAQGRPACPHAAPAQPRRHPGGARRGRDPPRRRRASCRSCAKPISSPSSARSRAWPRRPRPPRRCMPRGTTCGTSTPTQQEAAWLKGQPSDDRRIGAPAAPTTPPKRLVQITVSRPYIAHASMAPSCALAEFHDGHLTVLVARPGHASAAQEPGGGARPAGRSHHRAAPARRRLLRPQRRRRCRARRGADRACACPASCIRLQWRARRSSASSRSAPPCW